MEVIVYPGKRKTQIVKEEHHTLFLEVQGKAENNEANNEIIRFFSKNREYNPLGLSVKIIRGLKKRKKLLKFG